MHVEVERAVDQLTEWVEPAMKSSLVVFLLLLVSSQANAQALEYPDAKSPSQAVGMMKLNAFSADVLLRECSARLPDNAAEMAAQLRTWKTTEARTIERAERYYRKMAMQEPALKSQLVAAERYLKGNIADLEKASPNDKAAAVSTLCREYFADLASGVWRQRTPRLYEFLDAAP